MVTLWRTTIETPIGTMCAIASDNALCALEFEGPGRRHRLDGRRRRWFPPHVIEEGESPILTETRNWLTRYFDGASADSREIRVEMYGAEFERNVWKELLQIPAGATCSYGSIARRLSTIGAARAVGLANGANPIAIIVPCHRVIGSSGSLVGYGGGLDRKTWLLNHEKRWQAGRLF
jgi:methylated-DNA-[protein]-cysteine S-methyltransferase